MEGKLCPAAADKELGRGEPISLLKRSWIYRLTWAFTTHFGFMLDTTCVCCIPLEILKLGGFLDFLWSWTLLRIETGCVSVSPKWHSIACGCLLCILIYSWGHLYVVNNAVRTFPIDMISCYLGNSIGKRNQQGFQQFQHEFSEHQAWQRDLVAHDIANKGI